MKQVRQRKTRRGDRDERLQRLLMKSQLSYWTTGKMWGNEELFTRLNAYSTKLAKRYETRIPLEDLVAEGIYGAFLAVEKYRWVCQCGKRHRLPQDFIAHSLKCKESKGVPKMKIISVVKHYIRGYMRHHVNKWDRLLLAGSEPEFDVGEFGDPIYMRAIGMRIDDAYDPAEEARRVAEKEATFNELMQHFRRDNERASMFLLTHLYIGATKAEMTKGLSQFCNISLKNARETVRIFMERLQDGLEEEPSIVS